MHLHLVTLVSLDQWSRRIMCISTRGSSFFEIIYHRIMCILPRDSSLYYTTCMHSADDAVTRCMSVRLSHAGIQSTPLNISSKFFYHQIAPPL